MAASSGYAARTLTSRSRYGDVANTTAPSDGAIQPRRARHRQRNMNAVPAAHSASTASFIDVASDGTARWTTWTA